MKMIIIIQCNQGEVQELEDKDKDQLNKIQKLKI